MTKNIKTFEFKISGMTCEHCATSIDNNLQVNGIKKSSVSYTHENATVQFDENLISQETIKNKINEVGDYGVEDVKYINIDSSDRQKHLIIIGGGSAAFAATIQAKEYGTRVTMINEGLPIGGTCVNVGCVPSKNLIRVAESLYKANNNQFDGIQSTAKVENFKTIINEKNSLVLNLRKQKYINIITDMEDFELIEGRATIESETSVKVNERIIEGSHILIATGASPMIPDIQGLSEIDYLTNEEAFALDKLPKSLIILGGSYISLEIAQMFSRLGSKVTVLQRSNQILSSQQNDIANELRNYLKSEGLQIVTGNNIQSVLKKDGNIIVRSIVNSESKEFIAEKIIVATGRKANTKNMNLESFNIGIKNNSGVVVNKYLSTNVPTIYAAGDVLGSNMFVYTAAYEGKLAVDNAFGSVKKEANYKILPWVIFTDPQVAGIGLDEAEAGRHGIDYEVAKLPLSYVPRSIAAKDTRGFIKLLRNKEDDTLIGARILAPEGSELLMEVAICIKFGIKVKDLKDILHPYLTLSEGIKLAAITFDKNIEELSCCAT
ncbi:MAG: mercury(II) reductase [Epsilonproteobacteria bacterium]|nr:mercury(II) reductase [Campylobacterota bacterium]